MALWGGRFSGELDQAVAAFSSSIDIDAKMWAVDIRVSLAHTRMLAAQGILKAEDASDIERGLFEIGEEIKSGKWTFDPKAEDIHGEIEGRRSKKSVMRLSECTRPAVAMTKWRPTRDSI